MAEEKGWRRYRFATLLFLTYAYFYQGVDPNQHSRLFLTRAILTRGALSITPDHGYTIDKSMFHDEFFSDKAPGLSFLAVPIHAVMSLLDRLFGTSADDIWHERARLHFLTIILCAVAGVASTLCLGKIVARLGASHREKMLSMVAYGLGTIVFPFSTVLFAHQLAALLVLWCFMLAREPVQDAAALRKTALLLGFVGSFAIITEYPTALIVGVCAVAMLLSNRKKLGPIALWGIVGAAPVLLVHSFYLYRAFGSPFSLPYNHVFEPFFRVHHDEGIVGVNPPTLAGVYGITVSAYRGLFFYCPHVILCVFGFAYWLKDGAHKVELRIVTAIVIAYFFFNSSYYAWDGGGSTGPRHFVPALAFLSIPFLFFIRRSSTHFWIGVAATAVSVFFMLASTAVLVHQPEGEVLRSSPLYDTILVNFFRGELALNSQDIHTIGPRYDASYNLGMFAGLRGLASLAPLACLWLAAYAFDAARSIARISIFRRVGSVT